MDLNARVDVKFARFDVNFQTVTVTKPVIIFLDLKSINIKVLLILHTKFKPNIPSHFEDMDLSAWVNVIFFRVDVSFQTAIVT